MPAKINLIDWFNQNARIRLLVMRNVIACDNSREAMKVTAL